MSHCPLCRLFGYANSSPEQVPVGGACGYEQSIWLLGLSFQVATPRAQVRPLTGVMAKACAHMPESAILPPEASHSPGAFLSLYQ